MIKMELLLILISVATTILNFGSACLNYHAIYLRASNQRRKTKPWWSKLG